MEKKKCITVTCPKCKYSFDACFIDCGGGMQDRFAKCPKCEEYFTVNV